MIRRAAAWLGVALCCGACNPSGRQVDCRWPDEPTARLDLRTTADRRHLIADARRAEELAIRHADATRGHRSGQYAGPAEYQDTREQCLNALSREIASHHGILPADLRGAIGERDERLDAIILVLFTVIFGWTGSSVARRLFVRFPPDEPLPAALATAGAAIFLSAAGVILGGLGSSIVEMIQVGNTHLSYRTSRLPWNQHWLALFVGAVILFSIVAAVSWHRASAIADGAQGR